MFAYLKFRFARQIRRFRRELRVVRLYVQRYFDRHIWGKWHQIRIIRRFLFIWMAVFALAFIGMSAQIANLRKAYLVAGPEVGGVYSEGLVGSVKSINPILLTDDATSDVSRLIFSGLTRLNPSGQIEGDLASSWEVSGDGKTYTFHIRSSAKWQDGQPVTATDVVFTMLLIQNPDTRSPLSSSWQGVQVSALDSKTVSFVLPNAFSPFIYATTFGILPEHLLNGVDPQALRVSTFNQSPVGSGPFSFVAESPNGSNIELAPNQYYYFGKPLLDSFEFNLYPDTASMLAAYSKHQINAISRIDAGQETQVGQGTIHTMSRLDEVGLFMRTTSLVLTDTTVRTAISAAINRAKIVSLVGDDAADGVTLPILPGQLGYSALYQPPSYSVDEADSTLTADGWLMGPGSIRVKNGQMLKLTLATANTGDFPKIADLVRGELAEVGIATNIILTDTNSLEQSYIRPRNYDLLLYGIEIGPDPDVYAYWQSSQASDPGLNLSQYASTVADKELEAARLTSDPAIREARYEKFLATWTADAPAVMLYMPSYLYVTDASDLGIVSSRIGDPTDRFYGVQKWTVNTRPTLRTLSH
ncbi:MAG: peptide ABC transporter substrate-binding protein [Candidatus Saccharimonadia bacterium]